MSTIVLEQPQPVESSNDVEMEHIVCLCCYEGYSPPYKAMCGSYVNELYDGSMMIDRCVVCEDIQYSPCPYCGEK